MEISDGVIVGAIKRLGGRCEAVSLRKCLVGQGYRFDDNELYMCLKSLRNSMYLDFSGESVSEIGVIYLERD